MEFKKATIKKFMRKLGIKRATGTAIEEFTKVLEKYTGFLCEEAFYLAESDGRKTIRKNDILKAIAER